MIRGIIQQVIEGVIKRFSASGRPDESIADREYFQHYGYTSRPLRGAEIIIICEGNHIVAIAGDDRRYRIALEEGEAALYDDLGQKVHLTRTGIEAVSPIKATVTAPEVEIVAEVKVTMTTPIAEISGGGNQGHNDHAPPGGLRRYQSRRGHHGIKGKFLLSINDTQAIRSLFKDFYIDSVSTNYMAAGGSKQKKVRELLISNFEPKIDKKEPRADADSNVL